MIISDRHKTLFVHIPKCAGTSVRSALSRLSDFDTAKPEGVGKHPELGTIDYNHIPLFILREHFGETYQKLLSYRSYAIVRDPLSRFRSSVFQRLREYEPEPAHKLSNTAFQQRVGSIIDTLSSRAEEEQYLPYDFIHFQRQVDFVYDRERRLVENIYSTDQVMDLLREIAGPGVPLEPLAERQKKNATREYRSEAVRKLARALGALGYSEVRSFIPRRARAAVGQFLTVPGSKRLHDVFASDTVRDFVSSYYREDIRLVQQLAGAPIET